MLVGALSAAALAAIAVAVAALQPGVIARVLGGALGFVAGRVLAIRRQHVLAALARAGIGDGTRVANAMYRCLGQGLCELVALGVWPDPALTRRVLIGDEVRALLTPGRGLVVATAHLGNWDLLACAAAQQMPLTVITKRLSIGWLDRFWQQTRARYGVRWVSAGGAAHAARRALARGEAVAMLIDQAPERSRAQLAMPFLNQLAEVDLAPALVAMRARVPLALVVAERLQGGRQRALLLGHYPPPARPSRHWAEQTMQAATRALEAHIRARPEQWLWMHRRWKLSALAPSAAGIPAARGARLV